MSERWEGSSDFGSPGWEGARIGQIVILSAGDGACELRHLDDAECEPGALVLHTDPEDASDLALYDDAGAYRPLKTAPNLRRGWRLVIDRGSLALALELFYPARLGAWRALCAGRLATTPLRETLGRQSGMYRVTAKISDEQADRLVGGFCRSDGGCLRTILWKRDVSGTVPSTRLPATKYDPAWDQVLDAPGTQGFIPLLCQEACNLLVAEARAVVKGERESDEG